MKITAAFSLLLSLLFSAATLSASPETWTNRSGQTMTAELKAVEGENAVLVRENKIYRYPIAHLTDADQKRVKEWAEKAEEARAEKAREHAAQKGQSQTSTKQPAPSQTAGGIASSLSGNLVTVNRRGRGTADVSPSALDSKKLFAFYYSAGWCPPCRKFTPQLVSFYDRIKDNHPEFELVFVSADSDKTAMEKYMKDYNMSFPALKYDRRGLPVVNQHAAKGIPNLVFLDASGGVISQSYKNGNYLGPQAVLRDIESYLARGKL